MQKYCPVYLLPRWDAFCAKVAAYLDTLRGDPPLYRVQVGAFRERCYADAMLERLKAAGFEGFIVLPGDGSQRKTG